MNNTLTFCVQLKHTKRQSVRLGVGGRGGGDRGSEREKERKISERE